jgi:hypothetical protein
MQVKNILIEAMRLVGRGDVGDLFENDQLDDEGKRIKRTMLFSLNAVVDELARGYFPLKTKETLSSADGKFYFANFSKKPLKILKVFCGKIKVKWVLFAEYIEVNEHSITVEYEYAPDSINEGDDFVYPDFAVGERLLTFGMAAEYELINGEAESASVWESKYRTEIDRMLSLRPVNERVPLRRWI